jgi:endoglucanase
MTTISTRGLFAGIFFAAALALFAASDTLAQPPGITPVPGDVSQTPVPASRLARLAKGVNLSHWYWLPKDSSPETRKAFITDADLAALKAAGITHVRLPVEPDALWKTPGSHFDMEVLEPLLADIKRINAAGIAVIFDPHTSKQGPWLEIDPRDGRIDLLLMFWSEFAPVIVETDPEMVFIELLNEPHNIKDPSLWWRAQDRLIKTIRHRVPNHTIIATGDEWGGPAGLKRLFPHEDKNVVYSFHFYEPHIFSHQGASWGWAGWKHVAGLEYPSSEANAEAVAAAMLKGRENDEDAKSGAWAVRDYAKKPWNKDQILREIGLLQAWASTHNVPIWCGEFGVYKEHSPRASRLTWTRDLREALEGAGIGWCMWDYAGGFALTTGEPGSRAIDTEMATALGLNLPAAEKTKEEKKEAEKK